MSLPDKYKWLEEIGVLPKLVSAALQYLGVKEIKGAANNPVIMDMAKGLGLEKIYTNEDISWCALFLNHLIRITGKPQLKTDNDPYNLLRAKYLLHWGNPVNKGDERLGDVLVFNRPGGGHTALLIAKAGSNYLVLGANQSNSVSFVEIAKDRLIGARRYYATAMPASAKLYQVSGSGLVSVNES